MGRLLARNFSGPSIKFDGSVTKIVVGDLTDKLVGRSSFTLSAWVNLSGARNKFIIGVRNIAAANTALGLLVTSETDDVQVVGRATGGSTLIAPSYGFAGIKRKWALLTGTINLLTGVGNLYINGTLVATNTQAQVQTTLAADPTSLTCEIGATGVSGLLFDNYIAEPAIFNRALTDEEIRTIYEQGPVAYPKDGSCVLDYRFKEGAINGATIVDSSGKDNHGVLTLGSGRVYPYSIPVPNRVVIPGSMPIVAVESTGTTSIIVSDLALKTAFGETGAYVGSAAASITVGGWVKRKKAGSSSNRLFAKGSYVGGAGGYSDVLQTGGISSTVTGAVSVVAAFQTRYSPIISAYQHISVSSKTGAANTGVARFHTNGNVSQANPGVTITSAVTGDALNILGGTGAGVISIALPFLANRVLTDEEIYNIYSKAIFPADVLFWHGADSTGTKVMCHKGSYGNRPAEVVACDATLGSGNYFTDDTPWR